MELINIRSDPYLGSGSVIHDTKTQIPDPYKNNTDPKHLFLDLVMNQDCRCRRLFQEDLLLNLGEDLSPLMGALGEDLRPLVGALGEDLRPLGGALRLYKHLHILSLNQDLLHQSNIF